MLVRRLQPVPLKKFGTKKSPAFGWGLEDKADWLDC
jgi:hypothetical protein